MRSIIDNAVAVNAVLSFAFISHSLHVISEELAEPVAFIYNQMVVK
jgi:hypothetical protein